MTKKTAAEQAAYDKKIQHYFDNVGQYMCNNLNAHVISENVKDTKK
tara:strand:- start:4163 stop:4300 length:138 start_codon:yes stop_codon:yes gene_type:complete